MYAAIRNTQYVTLQLKAFTLVELLSTIAIIAVLATALVVYIPNYVTWAKNTADKQTLSVLNDALTRYKCQGGDVNKLTLGAPIGNIISRLKTPVDWAGMQHQFLQSGVTYQGRSLEAMGTGTQYRFYRYNTYSGEAPALNAPTSSNPFGGGVGYMSNNNDAGGYPIFQTETSSGFVAVKNASGTTIVYTAGAWHPQTQSASYTFWACAGPAGADNGTNSVASGNITALSCYGDNLTSLDISGLTQLQILSVNGNPITSLDCSHCPLLTNISCESSGTITSLNLTGCTALVYLAAAAQSFSSLNVSGLNQLQLLRLGYNSNLSTLNLTGCTALNDLWLDGQLVISKAALESLYTSLPTVSAGTVSVGAAAASKGSDTSIATAKGWTVSYTP